MFQVLAVMSTLLPSGNETSLLWMEEILHQLVTITITTTGILENPVNCGSIINYVKSYYS